MWNWVKNPIFQKKSGRYYSCDANSHSYRGSISTRKMLMSNNHGAFCLHWHSVAIGFYMCVLDIFTTHLTCFDTFWRLLSSWELNKASVVIGEKCITYYVYLFPSVLSGVSNLFLQKDQLWVFRKYTKWELHTSNLLDMPYADCMLFLAKSWPVPLSILQCIPFVKVMY